MRSKLITLAVGLCMGGFCASNAIAVQIFWITPTGGAFDDPNNWSTGIVPGILDNPIFNVPAPYSVTFPTPTATGPLSVSDGDVTFSFLGNLYFVDGDVDLGGTLTVDDPNGTLEVVGNINVISGGVLNAASTVISSGFIINEGAELRGSLTVTTTSGVVNSGTVAPGNSPGIITTLGGFSQTAVGTLEIEVGGLAAGSQHDQLRFSGDAMLAGRLHVPFINGYMPMMGHDIFFLEGVPGGGTVSGIFDIITLPDFLDSPVAVEVEYDSGRAFLSFVTPTGVFSALISIPSFWGDASTWSGDVPITSNVVDMISGAPFPTRVSLDVGTLASRRAFAHEVNLSSMIPEAPFTLGIPSGTSLSAISRVAVGANGIVEMSGGAVFTNLVRVDGGGKVLGNGTIAGDVILGDGLGSGEATLSPGSPGSAAGVIEVENLTVNSNGVVAVAVVGPGNFGQVIVEDTASLGGRLVIDVSDVIDVTALVGTTFEIVVAGTFDQIFDDIETVGGGGLVFFAPAVLPPAISPGLAPIVYTAQDCFEGNFTMFLKGDMNLDGGVDGDDAADFALALMDPDQYESDHCFVAPEHPGDFTDNEFVDFDDIESFVAAIPGLTAADIFALIDAMSVPEPTSCGLLLLGSGLLGATRSRRSKAFSQTIGLKSAP